MNAERDDLLTRVLARIPDAFANWDGQGRLWLNSFEGGNRICVTPDVLKFLGAFDGRRTLLDICGGPDARPEALAGPLELATKLHELRFLTSGAGFQSTYFKSYRLASHHGMLRDEPRMKAYRQALHEVVGQGDVVVDLGTGTGVLAIFACQAGAARVYAIDKSGWIDVAREVAADNGCADRIRFIHADAATVELPEQADVLVSEWMDTFLVQERMYLDVLAARDRFLKPGGAMVPFAARMYLQPVEAPDIYADRVGRWTSQMRTDYGLDMGVLERISLQDAPRRTIPAEAPLAPAAAIHQLDLAAAPPKPIGFVHETTFELTRSGALHGFSGHFEVDLSPQITLSTAASEPPTHWMQQYFPLPEVTVETGDQLHLKVMVVEAPTNMRQLNVDMRYRLERTGQTVVDREAAFREV